ncbi:hypothetical protein DSECCO2_502910 [anaerobic digester metagenome]
METGILLNEFINASMNEANIPEEILGRTIFINDLDFVHPSVQAASSMLKSKCSRLEPTTLIIYGREIRKCPMNKLVIIFI